MNKPVFKSMLVLSLLGAVSTSNANGFFGNNNSGFGNFFGGNNNNCNNWPIFTPMYWMEEMTSSFGNSNNGIFGNSNCNNGYSGYRFNPYQSPYGAPQYLANPYGQQAYAYRPPANSYYPQNSYRPTSNFSPFGNSGFGSNPFSSFNGSSSPFSSFGSPMGGNVSDGNGGIWIANVTDVNGNDGNAWYESDE